MIKYIFEDNEDYILSKFIKLAYTEEERSRLIFAGGNRNVLTKLKVIWDADSQFIVYLDVIPDNVSTITEYIKFHKWISSEDIQNVIVLPIPSIEYFFIKVLGDNAIDEVNVVFGSADYKRTDLVSKKLRGVCDSYEIYCKAVLNHKMDLRKRPLSKSKDLTVRKYYLVDCLCSKPYEKCTNEVSIIEKAWQVVKQLPVFYNGELNQYFKTHSVDLREVEKDCIRQYNTLVDKLYVAGIIYDKPYL